jgi:hypothetical protein
VSLPTWFCSTMLNENENELRSVIEMHTFLVTLIKQFDFSAPDNGQDVRKMQAGILTPVVAGEEEKGAQLPLKVTALRDE